MTLTKSQLDEYEQNGFLILKNILSPSEIKQTLAAIDHIHENIIVPSERKTFFCNEAKIVFQKTSLHRIVWIGAINQLFLKIGQDQRILNPVKQLLHHRNDLVQLINQVHFKLPYDGVEFEYHQDAQHRSYGTQYWKDILGNGSFVQTALALDPMTLANGPLEFFKGSHNEGPLGHSSQITAKHLNKYEKIVLELSPGSLAIFHPFVIHGSGKNTSNQSRRILINGYTVEGVNSYKYPGCGTGLKLKPFNLC